VTALVLDAGALIALDRNERAVWAMLRVAADDASTVLVPAGAIAQAWRDGRRQALLSRALAHCDEVPLDGVVARAAGLLCGRARTADVIDASVALTAAGVARHEDVAIVTSDPDDMRRLLSLLDAAARIVQV
jgi:hypothetical protein